MNHDEQDSITVLSIRLEGETAWETSKKLDRTDWENILSGIKAASPAGYEQLTKDCIAKQRRWDRFLACL